MMIIAGIISIYAASYDYDNASLFDFSEFSGKQIRWVGLSFILGIVLLLIEFIRSRKTNSHGKYSK
jgi:rod shape determining protein RodA